MNPYETVALLSQYLLFHFGEPEELLPYARGPVSGLHYPARYVRECIDRRRLPAHARALDLGCGVGGLTFELARICDEVVGIDFSRRFIAAARELQRRGRLRYDRVDSGVLTTPRTARVPASIDRSRVAFEVGDATALRDDIDVFDVVIMANLLDRLREPMRCLRRLGKIVKPGGQVVISSPYTWLEDYTPRSNWLGGVVRRGRRLDTHDSLVRALRGDFTLERRIDVPFTMRDHARKFQWAVADATVWVRRP
ncbi:MAG TPA: putative 4-mercaptohistidine N1-methyltransferase [Candidatus Limnocylindria bacterium]|nr:putative 4-mercaptohistidine N1-methyltransferase [Candidatus Limnocylindria bacterium]